MENQSIVLQAQLEQAKTNHILHLLLSIITGGLWVLVWVLVANQNSAKRTRLLRQAQGKSKTSGFEKFIYVLLGAPVVFILALAIIGTL